MNILETKLNKYPFSTLTLSTGFTLARIVLTPCIMISMVMHEWGLACLLFSLAAFTDIIDGALARFLQEETALGAYLDPVADKLLLSACYGTLACIDSPLFKIPTWFVGVIVAKEVLLIGGTIYVSLIKHAVAIKPTIAGKMATAVQVGFIWWLFACAFFHWVPIATFYTFLYTITVLTLGTLLQYAWIGYQGLR
jgi:cardiolipin synthase (CMP-forming)